MLWSKVCAWWTLGLLTWNVAAAEDWPAFRGPRGNGISAETSVPLNWATDRNVAWKIPLPTPGNGSPIVSAGRVFVTCAEDARGHDRSLYCFDARTGERQWVRTIRFGRDMPTHETNPHCSTTPVADGSRVVVWHASAGLHCYDFAGQPVWSRELGEFRHMWGHGTSPILHDGNVILHSGPGKRVFIAAFSLQDGATVWEHAEPVEGDGERNAAGHYMGSWATPVIARVDGRAQVVCSMSTRVVGLDANSGKLVWSCDGISGPRGDLSYSSPMIDADLCVVTGGFSGPGLGLRLGGTGNVTSSNRLWRNTRNPQSIGSGVLLGKYVYRPNADRRGPVECLDGTTGESVWKASVPGTVWGSVVLAANRMYATTRQGRTLVFEPNPREFRLLANNNLSEPSHSTIAVAGGRIYLRTFRHLWCIGEEDESARPAGKVR